MALTKDGAYGLLCEAIVNQAVSDYDSLKRRGIDSATEKHYTYSTKEIEDFINSDWGRAIIRGAQY